MENSKIYYFVRRLGQEHIFKASDSKALCGVPMISFNYVNDIPPSERTTCRECQQLYANMLEKERTAEIHGFSDDNRKRLRNIIERKWNSIADDIFITDEGEPDYEKIYSRLDVVEIVMDVIGNDLSVKDATVVKKFKDLGWMSPEMKEVIVKTIPTKHYVY